MHANADVVAEALAAVATRDASSFEQHYTRDCVWHIHGHHRFSGTYSGLGEVLSYLSSLFEETQDTIVIEPHDLLASDQHVVLICTVRAQRPDGRELADRSVMVIHLTGEKISEMWFYPGDAMALEAFWR